jgi:hypothetical protein
LFANRPEGCPVGGVDPPANAEVAGVTDDRFGAQGSVFLEVLLEPAGLVVADQLRVDPLGDHLGAECVGGSAADPPVEDQRDLGRAADVQVVVGGSTGGQ